MRQCKVRQAHRQKSGIARAAGACLLFGACMNQVPRSASGDMDPSDPDDNSPSAAAADARATPPRVDTMDVSPDVALSRDGASQTTGSDVDGNPADGSKDVDARQALPDVAAAVSAFHCPKADSVLCEDFESGALDPKKWSKGQSQSGATVAIDTTRAVSGKYALHMKVGNLGESRGWIETVDKIPVAGSHVFIRAFVYIRPNAFQRHVSVLKVVSSSYTGYVINLFGTSSGAVFREFWHYQSKGEPTGSLVSATKVPFGRWACWEWELAGTDNGLRFWLDDKVVSDMAVDKTRKWLAPKDATLNFRWDMYHEEPTQPNGFEVWMDDIAVSHQRIGCTL